MKSINHHTPPLATHKHHSVSRYGLPGGVLQTHIFYLPKTVRTKARAAITSSHLVVLAVNSPAATTGNLSVLIPTSAGFLLLYWIANFVVPKMIMKDLQSDDESKDQIPNEEESMPLSKTINSKPKRKVSKAPSDGK